MESRVKTYRIILATVALAAFAGNASLAQHGSGRSAPHGPAHHQSAAGGSEAAAAAAGKIAPNPTIEVERSAGRSTLPATVNGVAGRKGGEVGNDAGAKSSTVKTGAAVPGIDSIRPDVVNASLRRRAMRPSLMTDAPKKVPTIVTPGNIVVHPPIAPQAVTAKNAIGVSAPGTSIQNQAVAHPPAGGMVHGDVAKTSIGGNVSEVRRNLHPVPVVGAVPPTGLSGSTMGRPAVNAAALGGPAHIVSGIGGASIRPKY